MLQARYAHDRAWGTLKVGLMFEDKLVFEDETLTEQEQLDGAEMLTQELNRRTEYEKWVRGPEGR